MMKFHGVIPAALCPWRPDLGLDKASFKRHLMRLFSTPGTTGVLVNGNTSEVAACTIEEQTQLLTMATELADGKTVFSGVQLDDDAFTATAQRWQNIGAHALLVFPPKKIDLADAEGKRAVINQWRSLARATDLPLVLFQYSVSSGRSYSLELIHEIASEVESFAGVKDFCGDEDLHRKTIEMMHTQFDLAVLTSHTRWLSKSLACGVDGVFSTAGSIFSAEQAQLFEAFNRNDLRAAARLALELDTKMECLAAATLADQLPMFKVAAKYLGDFAGLDVRPPLTKVSDEQEQALLTRLRSAERSSLQAEA